MIKPSVMKYVSKLLKTTKVMVMLAHSMLTQIALVPHQHFRNLFVMDQNQTTCLIVKKTQIQLAEMEKKTIGP